MDKKIKILNILISEFLQPSISIYSVMKLGFILVLCLVSRLFNNFHNKNT